MEKRWNVACVVGARPNFMKIGPIIKGFAPTPIRPLLVHTGQHYDERLNNAFFQQLGIPTPDVNLGVGSGSHAVQTAEVMKRFEPVVADGKVDAVLVVGDVNSTLACALVASKLGIPVVHVEAGLRSYDREMPEEINRVLTDAISDLLFVTEEGAFANLAREGIPAERVRFVGNVMIDTLLANRQRLPDAASVLAEAVGKGMLAEGSAFTLLTLHRPSNVDDPTKLRSLLQAVRDASEGMPIVFPVHPRTEAKIRDAGLSDLVKPPIFVPLPPVGYLEMISLMTGAKFVLTDSGGVQEETTALGVPCMTLRDNTERPVTIDQGTNTLIGTDPARIPEKIAAALVSLPMRGSRMPPLWDGKAGIRIAADLLAFLGGRA